MPLHAVCPHCQKAVNIKDEYAGKMVRCPGCQSVFQGPSAADEPTVAPPPEPQQQFFQEPSAVNDLPVTHSPEPQREDWNYSSASAEGIPGECTVGDWSKVINGLLSYSFGIRASMLSLVLMIVLVVALAAYTVSLPTPVVERLGPAGGPYWGTRTTTQLSPARPNEVLMFAMVLLIAGPLLTAMVLTLAGQWRCSAAPEHVSNRALGMIGACCSSFCYFSILLVLSGLVFPAFLIVGNYLSILGSVTMLVGHIPFLIYLHGLALRFGDEKLGKNILYYLLTSLVFPLVFLLLFGLFFFPMDALGRKSVSRSIYVISSLHIFFIATVFFMLIYYARLVNALRRRILVKTGAAA